MSEQSQEDRQTARLFIGHREMACDINHAISSLMARAIAYILVRWWLDPQVVQVIKYWGRLYNTYHRKNN